MNVSAWSIRNPIPAILGFAMLTFLGVMAFKAMKIVSRTEEDRAREQLYGISLQDVRGYLEGYKKPLHPPPDYPRSALNDEANWIKTKEFIKTLWEKMGSADYRDIGKVTELSRGFLERLTGRDRKNAMVPLLVLHQLLKLYFKAG